MPRQPSWPGQARAGRPRKRSDGFRLLPQVLSHVPPAIPDQRPPRVWKFWGTALWGLFIFAAMFVGQLAVIVYFVLRQGGSFDFAEAIRVVGGGLTISLSVIMGLPAVLLAMWIAIRPTRTPFADYLALRWTSWRNFVDRRRRAGRAGRRLGPAVARARARGDAGLHGRRAEIGAGRRRAVAAGDRVLRRRAGSEEIFRARLPLSRLVGIVAAASPARSSCRRWPGPRCTCNTTGSSSARCFRSACCSAICAIAPARPG